MISGYIRMVSMNSVKPMNFNILVPELTDFEISILEFKDLGTQNERNISFYFYLEPME